MDPSSSLVVVSPISHNCTHQVFPSFHGPDVRRGFLSHILKEFRRKGIEPFNDNKIVTSKSIGPELIEAIRGSKISIILLSRNYASSSWCLNELVEIMKCREELGQIVMTVFYEVDPTDVKKQTGDFGNVFKKTCEGKTKEDIGRWRHALAEVAKIAGYHSRNWDNEATMTERITSDVSNKLNNSTPSNDFDCLIGMRAHMEKMEPMLCLGSDEVKMIGIWGPSGIGKTTIAGYVFQRHFNNYVLRVFMDDIKTFMDTSRLATICSNDRNTKLKLQEHLLSRIFNQKDIEAPHLGVVKDRLKDKKVLIVLDDVHRSVILDAMAEDNRWFGPGSRIIITTQDKRLLTAHGIKEIYNVPFPTSDEALQIFCMKAFGQNFPKEGFEELAWEVTSLVGELPLGLKVMGSHFRQMPKDDWTNELQRLRNHPHGDIMSILRFSYDALDDEEKDLFLHLACLCNRRTIKEVEALLVKRFRDLKRQLRILFDKSLIDISHTWVFMPDLLAQLGREIVRKQSIQERWVLFDDREISDLPTHTTSSKSVMGISLNLSQMDDQSFISERVFEEMCNLQFLRVYDDRIDRTDRTDHIERIDCDRFYLPQKLKLLYWDYFPMTCLPFNFQTDSLVALHMKRSKLEKLWEGIRPLRNLKMMNFWESKRLKDLPDLSTATSLHDLNLSGCSSLVKLPSSIRNATNLHGLNLCDCSSLVKLPSSIGNATNLHKLNLRGCSSLVELPSSIWNYSNFGELNLSDCSSLVKLPSSIGNDIINLWQLNLSGCASLVKLPSSIGNATNLRKLYLRGCSSLVELPSSIENLHKLSRMDLEGCSKVESLPTNINLESLKLLNLTNCSRLKTFPEISINLGYLWLIGTAIEEVPSSIKSWPRLRLLCMSYNAKLKEFPHALESITTLSFNDAEIKQVISLVKGFSRLNEIVLDGCRKLVSLPQLPDSISFLSAENCESLERLDCSFHHQKMYLNFGNCFKLNNEARDLIFKASPPRDFLNCLPGREVPAYFTNRAVGGSVRVKLNESVLPTPLRFKACILLVNKVEDEAGKSEYLALSCHIMGKRNEFNYKCTPNHLYIFELQAKTTSSELLFEFEISSDKWKIRECGVRLLTPDEIIETKQDEISDDDDDDDHDHDQCHYHDHLHTMFTS